MVISLTDSLDPQPFSSLRGPCSHDRSILRAQTMAMTIAPILIEVKFEAWFRGLAEREQEWALKVAPEDSMIR
jgi:hypothetical protein